MSKTMSFKGARIDLENMTLVEETKDSYEEFDLMDILREWDGVENVSISIKKDDEIKPANQDERDD
jgi:hypothetical protein